MDMAWLQVTDLDLQHPKMDAHGLQAAQVLRLREVALRAIMEGRSGNFPAGQSGLQHAPARQTQIERLLTLIADGSNRPRPAAGGLECHA